MIRTGATEHLTVTEAKAALEIAAEGAVIVYARGDIAKDSSDSSPGRKPGSGNDGNADVMPLRELRKFIWESYKRGQVALVQRRMGENCFEYQARKRNLPGHSANEAQHDVAGNEAAGGNAARCASNQPAKKKHANTCI
jgi:hypothetical protein